MSDEDGAAILRRRAKLVALALSGLTGCTGMAPGKDPPSPAALADLGPTLVPVPEEPEAEPEPEEAEPPWEPPAEADPREVAHAEERKRRLLHPPATYPTACLSIAPMVCLWKKAWDSDEPVD